MARATEAVVFQHFLGKMLRDMKTSKTVLVSTTVQLYSMELILQVRKHIISVIINYFQQPVRFGL